MYRNTLAKKPTAKKAPRTADSGHESDELPLAQRPRGDEGEGVGEEEALEDEGEGEAGEGEGEEDEGEEGEGSEEEEMEGEEEEEEKEKQKQRPAKKRARKGGKQVPDEFSKIILAQYKHHAPNADKPFSVLGKYEYTIPGCVPGEYPKLGSNSVEARWNVPMRAIIGLVWKDFTKANPAYLALLSYWMLLAAFKSGSYDWVRRPTTPKQLARVPRTPRKAAEIQETDKGWESKFGCRLLEAKAAAVAAGTPFSNDDVVPTDMEPYLPLAAQLKAASGVQLDSVVRCQDPVGVHQDPVVRCQDPVGQDPVVWCQNPVGQDLVVWCQDPVVWCQNPVGQDPVVRCQDPVDPVSHNPVVRYQDPVEKDTHRRTLYRDTHGLWRLTGKDKVVVPNDSELRNHILHEMHDAVYSGVYFKPGGLLNPLSIPDYRWESVSMDFITKLPSGSHGYDAICVFVDRLSKMVHFVPCREDLKARRFAQLFIDHVYKLHGMPAELISDRGSLFTSVAAREAADAARLVSPRDAAIARLPANIDPASPAAIELINLLEEQAWPEAHTEYPVYLHGRSVTEHEAMLEASLQRMVARNAAADAPLVEEGQLEDDDEEEELDERDTAIQELHASLQAREDVLVAVQARLTALEASQAAVNAGGILRFDLRPTYGRTPLSPRLQRATMFTVRGNGGRSDLGGFSLKRDFQPAWLYPVRSMATRSRIRGLMCSTSNVIKRKFYDRDVSTALNIARIATGPGRPRELNS
ncbi:hypothetical protein QJQ45_007516 [Haematococcus lacustris]|nr:hypothetical protein QJQ45_007516 [Haematococcus lacustris]